MSCGDGVKAEGRRTEGRKKAEEVEVRIIGITQQPPQRSNREICGIRPIRHKLPSVSVYSACSAVSSIWVLVLLGSTISGFGVRPCSRPGFIRPAPPPQWLRSHPKEREHHQRKEQSVRQDKNCRRRIPKDESFQPASDKTARLPCWFAPRDPQCTFKQGQRTIQAAHGFTY